MPEPSLSLSKAPIVEAVVDIDCEMERDAPGGALDGRAPAGVQRIRGRPLPRDEGRP